jgi:hypothetical protein
MTTDPNKSEKGVMSDCAAGDQEISIDELDNASGGFNVGAAVMQAYKTAVAKDLARSQGCLGPTDGPLGNTAKEIPSGKVHEV